MSTHKPAQQSPLFKHAAPWGLHVFGPQNPLEHKLSQHSPAVVQAAPCGLHCEPPQKPLKQSKLQHCSENVHAEPVGLHCEPPQNPSTQSRLQHSTVVVQAEPCGEQICVGLHIPPLQSSTPQQSSCAEHVSPILPHVVGFGSPNVSSYSPERDPHEANVKTRVVTIATMEAIRAVGERRMSAV